MQSLRATLATVACLLLGAHFLRSGGLAVAMVVGALPLLLAVPRVWAPRVVQGVLALGSIEWLRTLARLVEARRALGQPTARLAAILLFAAAVTALAALLLQSWQRRAHATRLAAAGAS